MTGLKSKAFDTDRHAPLWVPILGSTSSRQRFMPSRYFSYSLFWRFSIHGRPQGSSFWSSFTASDHSLSSKAI